MQRVLTYTEDGSFTFRVPAMDEQYHSLKGALTESEYVFIHYGLEQICKKELTIFEAGFGTGLNAILTWNFAREKRRHINYLTIEKYPLTKNEAAFLNYGELMSDLGTKEFEALHDIPWNEKIVLDEFFTICKFQSDLRGFNIPEPIDLCFFDAFGPDKQPDLWNIEIFKEIFRVMKSDGLLTTYSSKGTVRKMLSEVGFLVHKVPGPPGKREMVNAWKKSSDQISH
jgi:tRNA U34 5-methylaminomethyl-2-thiouridine-forming methyltransferase MnmC